MPGDWGCKWKIEEGWNNGMLECQGSGREVKTENSLICIAAGQILGT
jgi:hypothetical protein